MKKKKAKKRKKPLRSKFIKVAAPHGAATIKTNFYVYEEAAAKTREQEKMVGGCD